LVSTRPAEDVNTNVDPGDPEVAAQVQEEINARAAVGLIGSSLAFEAVVLVVAAWVFVRRDY